MSRSKSTVAPRPAPLTRRPPAAREPFKEVRDEACSLLAALSYKRLWMVEDTFRTMKSILATRPIFHKTDETILGHVFCSFLALLLRTEREDRLARKGHGDLEWADVIRDLDSLEEVEIEKDGKRYG